jgi:hypothetical protein
MCICHGRMQYERNGLIHKSLCITHSLWLHHVSLDDLPSPRRVESGQLPHVRGVVGEDLELGVEVEVEKDQSSQRLAQVLASGSQVRRGRVEVQAAVECPDGQTERSYMTCVKPLPSCTWPLTRVADRQEVRAKTTDEPLTLVVNKWIPV